MTVPNTVSSTCESRDSANAVPLLAGFAQEAIEARRLGVLILAACLTFAGQLWAASVLAHCAEIVAFAPELRDAWRSDSAEAP